MKINSIDIGNFGKLQNFSLKLSDGFNIIYGNNEDGKTTIMAFIRLMFYGNYGRSSDLNKNPLQKYTPWNGQKMYGSISFEHLNTHYRLERIFKANGFSSEITLWNTDKGTREKLTEKSEIGERFFGMGNAGFEKSTYIGQIGSLSNVFANDKTDELTKRLSSMVTTGDEDVSATQILNNLENARKKYVARNKNGLLDINQEKLYNMQCELEYKRSLELQKNSLKNKYQQTLSELEECHKLYEDFKSKRDNVEITKQLEEISSEINHKRVIAELEQQLSNHKQLLSSPNVDIDEEFINICNQSVQDIKIIEEKLSEQRQTLANLQDKVKSNNNNFVDIEQLNVQLENAIEERDKLNTTKLQLEKLQNLKSATEEKISSITEFCNSYSKNNINKQVSKTYIFVGIFIIILSVILGFVLSSFFFTLSIFGIGCIIYYFIQNKTIATTSNNDTIIKKYNTQKMYAESQLEKYIEQIQELSTSFNYKSLENMNKLICELSLQKKQSETLERSTNNYSFSLKECSNNINRLNSQLNEKTNALFRMFGEYKEVNSLKQIEKELYSIESTMNEISSINIKMNAYKSSQNSRLAYLSLEKLINMQNELQNSISKEECLHLSNIRIDDGDNLTSKLQHLTEIAAKQNTELKTCFKDSDNIASFENEITRLQETIKKQQLNYECIKLAQEVINEAKDEIQTSFSPILRQKTSQLLSLITNGKYNKVIISADFDISVFDTHTSSFKQWQYLSSGTADQIYFAFRLSVATLMTQAENPLPLFLDDIFMQYDDTRTKQGMEFLNAYQNSTQIIFFTCHRNMLEKAKSSIQDGTFYSLIKS